MMLLGGSKDEHFSCFYSSCQLGLSIGAKLAFFTYFHEKGHHLWGGLYIRLKDWDKPEGQRVRWIWPLTLLTYLLGIQEQLQLTSQSSSSLTWRHPLLRSGMWPPHSPLRRLAGEKKRKSYNHKTTIWVSHEYYLNPEFYKILSRAFWVIAILVFFPSGARVDFKGLISYWSGWNRVWPQNT